jgi:hypothetical protein
MFYKIFYRVALIALALALLIIAGILEARQKYGKQMQEEKERMDKLAASIQKLDEISKNAVLKPEEIAAVYSYNPVKETNNLIDEIYMGIEPAEKKMISMEGYFLTYHKARDLKEQLAKFEKFVLDSLHSNKLFSAGIMNFGERKKKGKKVSWENYYFESVSKDSVISYLRQMKATVALSEMRMIKRNSGK